MTARHRHETKLSAPNESLHVIPYDKKEDRRVDNAQMHAGEGQDESKHLAAHTGQHSYLLERRAREESTRRKYHLCFFLQGTLVLPNLHSVVYDSDHWATPWKFNPNHFLDLDGNFVHKEAFLPFSAGNAQTFQHLSSFCLAAQQQTFQKHSRTLRNVLIKIYLAQRFKVAHFPVKPTDLVLFYLFFVEFSFTLLISFLFPRRAPCVFGGTDGTS